MAGTEIDVVVGLDVGTSGIAIAVMDNGYGAKQELLGLGFSPSIGIEKGVIVDMDAAAGAIRIAVAEAEAATGVNLNSVYASIDMPGMISRRGSVKYSIDNRRRINRRDLQEVRQKLYASILPTDYIVGQLIDIIFRIDGKPVAIPLGYKGKELHIEATVIAVPGDKMEKAQRCLRQAGLKVKQTVAGSLATAKAVLAVVEQELGAVCVDIGSSMTKVAYINHGMLEQMDIYPVGAGHITADLAVGLHTSMEVADAIKCKYGLQPITGHINVQNLSGRNYHTVPGELVNKIIRSRVEEIIDFVNQFITRLQLTSTLPGGVVVAGGGAMLNGLPELGQNYWAMSVRRGHSRGIPENKEEKEMFRYTNAVGSALWGASQKPAACKVEPATEIGIMGRLRNWLC